MQGALRTFPILLPYFQTELDIASRKRVNFERLAKYMMSKPKTERNQDWTR